MAMVKPARCSPRERASLGSLDDPITILLEMSQGFDAYHTAMRATITGPRLGHAQQLPRQSAAQSIRQQEERDGK